MGGQLISNILGQKSVSITKKGQKSVIDNFDGFNC